MKVKVISEKENVLLKRKEVVFKVDHNETGSTPPRTEVKKALAALLGVNHDLVFIKKYETKTGTLTALGRANIYLTLEQAKKIEPEYIIKRNLPPTPPPEEKEAKEPAKEAAMEEKGELEKGETVEDAKEEQQNE